MSKSEADLPLHNDCPKRVAWRRQHGLPQGGAQSKHEKGLLLARTRGRAGSICFSCLFFVWMFFGFLLLEVVSFLVYLYIGVKGLWRIKSAGKLETNRRKTIRRNAVGKAGWTSCFLPWPVGNYNPCKLSCLRSSRAERNIDIDIYIYIEIY